MARVRDLLWSVSEGDMFLLVRLCIFFMLSYADYRRSTDAVSRIRVAESMPSSDDLRQYCPILYITHSIPLALCTTFDDVATVAAVTRM
jgi:hypothetical protein